MIYLPLRTRHGRKLLKLLKQRITLSTHSTIKYSIISTVSSRVHQFIWPAMSHPIPLSIYRPPTPNESAAATANKRFRSPEQHHEKQINHN